VDAGIRWHDVEGTTPPESKSFFGSFFSKKEPLTLEIIL
jgi:hypothetical protein